MGDVRKRRVGPPLLFASAFDNGLADRKLKSAFKRFNGNNQATSYTNLVNLRPPRSGGDCSVAMPPNRSIDWSFTKK